MNLTFIFLIKKGNNLSSRNIQLYFLSLLFFTLLLSACSGSGSSSVSSTSSYMSINGKTYSDVPNSTLTIVNVEQTSTFNYKLGGPAYSIIMIDKTSGNSAFITTLTTASGLPTVNSLNGSSGDTLVTLIEKNGSTTSLMGDYANPASTNGNVTIMTFGDVGQQVAGSFAMNLCALNTTCSTTVKNYKGDFSATRNANYGSSASPFNISLVTPLNIQYYHGIAPATGKNYYQLTTKATAGTATITINPTIDVDLAVYTDAAFSVPATCDVINILNVPGNGLETCAISVAANQKLYFSVSQKPGVTALDTYIVNATE